MVHPWLKFDPEKEIERICELLRNTLIDFKRRGYVLGVSGGIDSSMTLGLCVKAIGPERVLVLQMPELHSADETLRLSALIADHFGVRKELENISGILEAEGFYKRYNAAVGSVVPGYSDGWKSKMVLHSGLQSGHLPVFHLVAQSPDGAIIDVRLPPTAYLEIVAATNFKQRTRKMLEYYYADKFNYAVAGTPNLLEYDQGFFVKLGDGSADVKPIAHLYKTQVYELAEHLGIPSEIRSRPPTTDTYSLPQGQDEFYFSLPYEKMDLCLFGKDHSLPPEQVAETVGLTKDQVEKVYKDIDSKRRMAKYLHAAPILVPS